MRGKILTGLVIVGLIIAIANFSGGFAYFTDVEASSGNTFQTGAWAISANVDIDPDTLNKNSNGNWITARIELPKDRYYVEDIDVSTVKLHYEDNSVPAEPHPTNVGDEDLDGENDRMVKFDRGEVIDMLGTATGEITFKVTGIVEHSTGNERVEFSGGDQITVKDPPNANSESS